MSCFERFKERTFPSFDISALPGPKDKGILGRLKISSSPVIAKHLLVPLDDLRMKRGLMWNLPVDESVVLLLCTRNSVIGRYFSSRQVVV